MPDIERQSSNSWQSINKKSRDERGEYFSQQLDAATQNYIRAIQNYRQLKLQFISQVNKISAEEITKKTENDLLKSFADEYNKEIQNVNLGQEDIEIIQNLFQTLALAVTRQLISKDANFAEFSQELNKLENNKQIKRRDFINAYQRRRNESEEKLVDLLNIAKINSLTDFLASAGITSQFNISTSQEEAIRGMVRRIIFIRATQFQGYSQQMYSIVGDVLSKPEVLSGFNRNLGGFGTETAIIQGFTNLKLAAQQTKGFLVDGKESIYDGVICLGDNGIQTIKQSNNDYFSKLLTILETGINNLSGEGITDPAEIEQLYKDAQSSYGIQSKKGWILPQKTTVGYNKLFYSLGSRASLSAFSKINTQQPSYERGWHHSVYLVSKEITKVLGERQVLFKTNNEFIWTSDLIETMMNYKLWLNYYFKRSKGQFYYLATPEMVFQPAMYLYNVKWQMKQNSKKKK